MVSWFVHTYMHAYIHTYILLSHSQTAFSSLLFGWEEKGSGNLTLQFHWYRIPKNWGLLIGADEMKEVLILCMWVTAHSTISWACTLARVQLTGQHNIFHLLFSFVPDILFSIYKQQVHLSLAMIASTYF